MKSGVKCPDKLAAYVEKAFQKCINANEREFMEAVLKKICDSSKARGTLFQKDWDALALPSLPRESKCFISVHSSILRLTVPSLQQQVGVSRTHFYPIPNSSISIQAAVPVWNAFIIVNTEQVQCILTGIVAVPGIIIILFTGK